MPVQNIARPKAFAFDPLNELILPACPQIDTKTQISKTSEIVELVADTEVPCQSH